MSLGAQLRLVRLSAGLVGRLPAGHLAYLARRMRNEKPHTFGGELRINSFFPPYPSPAFERFRRAVVARRRVPYSAYLAVTGECPYRCPHCSYARRRPGSVSREKLLAVVAEIKALGTATLGLTGGEPLLRDDLEALLAAARPEMATILFTSGHGLDAARAKRLAAAGVTNVTVGLESSDPAAHDRVRGRSGSFDEAAAAVAACRDAGVYVAVSTIGTPEKIAGGDLEGTLDLSAAWGAQELRILPPVATGGWAGRASVMLTADQRTALARFHIEHNRRRGGPATPEGNFLRRTLTPLGRLHALGNTLVLGLEGRGNGEDPQAGGHEPQAARHQRRAPRREDKRPVVQGVAEAGGKRDDDRAARRRQRPADQDVVEDARQPLVNPVRVADHVRHQHGEQGEAQIGRPGADQRAAEHPPATAEPRAARGQKHRVVCHAQQQNGHQVAAP